MATVIIIGMKIFNITYLGGLLLLAVRPVRLKHPPGWCLVIKLGQQDLG
jgi:hypothetical protein